ncbi:MAG: hypothetical protein NXI24_23700 [bacterium]|nr:hypothetical protein [bacterium]
MNDELDKNNKKYSQRELQAHLHEIYESAGPEGSQAMSPAAAEFVRTHPVGRREARIASSIAGGIGELPRLSVPARLRAMVLDRLGRPAYRWYHIAAAAMLAALSPIVFQEAQISGALAIEAHWMPWVYISFGLLNVMLVVPVAFHIFLNRRDDIEQLGRSFDDYLESPGRFLGRFRG